MIQPMYSNVGFVQQLEVRKGATFPIELRVVYADENPFDLSEHEVRATIRHKTDSAFVPISFEFAAGDPSGVIQGTLSAEDADTLVANDNKMAVPVYWWTCDIKTPTNEILSFCHGDVFVRAGAVDWN